MPLDILLKSSPEILLVNFVHDEYQTEVPNNMKVALEVAKTQAACLSEAGVLLELKCPITGSYFNEDIKDWTIGPNWQQTH